MLGKSCVVYFSASGVTEKIATLLAKGIGSDLYKIHPVEPYTKKDLNWLNPRSRSSVEMKNKSFRPEMTIALDGVEQYDYIFVGFPIWWYVAPTIVNTFLEKYDLTGKHVIPFATSGSSGMGNTCAELAPSCPGAILHEGKRFKKKASLQELVDWAEDETQRLDK